MYDRLLLGYVNRISLIPVHLMGRGSLRATGVSEKVADTEEFAETGSRI